VALARSPRSIRGTAIVSFGFLLLAVLIFWVYWPGVYGPPVLDDYSNIHNLPHQDASLSAVIEGISQSNASPLKRPVAVVTFALEKIFLENAVVVGKVINIFIHVLNVVLVYLLVGQVLLAFGAKLPQAIRFLIVGCWGFAPLFVSTVLYHVQRMTLMACFFCLSALLLYIYWRRLGSGWRFSYSVIIGSLVIVGVGSKENAALAPFLMYTFEIFYRRQLRTESAQIPLSSLIGSGLVLVLIAGSLAFALIPRLTILYEARPFGIVERLLTQSWILWDYVGQFFLPDLGRLGVFHDDINAAGGVLDPPVVAISIFGWVLLASGVLWCIKKRQFLVTAFGFSFYLVAHGMESTIVPLELYFEHRNYLPSVGLLLGVAGALSSFFNRFRISSAPFAALGCLYLIFFMSCTSSQAQIWSSQSLMALNAVAHHPMSARANVALALLYANRGEYLAARQYSVRASDLLARRGLDDDLAIRNITLACLANTPITDSDLLGIEKLSTLETDVAFTAFGQLADLFADDACPNVDTSRLADRLNWVVSSQSSGKPSTKLLKHLASINNAIGDYERAFAYSHRAASRGDMSPETLLMKMHFALATERIDDYRMARGQLLQLERQGLLTDQQERVLALYGPQ